MMEGPKVTRPMEREQCVVCLRGCVGVHTCVGGGTADGDKSRQ